MALGESEYFVIPDWPAPANVRALVTTRNGGCSGGVFSSNNLGTDVGDSAVDVTSNREQLIVSLPGEPDIQWLSQMHGIDVVEIDHCSNLLEADGCFTQKSNLACSVLTADCLPVFFTTKSGSSIAIAHAGWRGLAAGVLQNTLEKFSVKAQDILVWLGPAIGPCHYEVGDEVRNEFLRLCRGQQEYAEIDSRGFKKNAGDSKWTVDLYTIARIKLHYQGVKNIFGGDFCTVCDQVRFFSYRRDGETGRMANLIYLHS